MSRGQPVERVLRSLFVGDSEILGPGCGGDGVKESTYEGRVLMSQPVKGGF